MNPEDTERTVKQSDQDGQDQTRTVADQSALPQVIARAYVSDGKFQAGDVVGENYKIIDLIGVGGMGYVYKVKHTILQKIYAMKTIDSEQVSEIAWRRLQVEAQAIARINHANIVGIHNLGLHEGKIPYYVMDFLQGSNLAQILKRTKSLSLNDSLPMFIEICDGLGFAHKKGIVHRDVKPGNIVILDQADASGASVKLVDFGIAKLAGTVDPDNQKLTTKGEIFGSPLYMSPEQCEGGKTDARSDIYSLGCTFFETLTGRVPFRGDNKIATMLMHSQDTPPTLKQASGIDFPDSMEHLIATMLAKAPMNRYPNLEKVGSDLEKILAGEEINTSPFIDLERYGENSEAIIDEEEEIQIVKPVQTKLNTFAITGLLLVFGAVITIVTVIQVYTARQAKLVTPILPGTAAAKENELATVSETAGTVTPAVVSKSSSETIEFYSTEINRGKSILFDFPFDQSIGRIGNLLMKVRKEAKGRVVLKINGQVSFEANEYLCAHPNLIDFFRPTDLYAFSLPEVMAKFVDGNVLMPHIAKLKSLVHLRLKSTECNDSIIPYLNQLPNLRYLNVSTTNITGSGLAKFKGLKDLTELQSNFTKESFQLLTALKGSESLQRLSIENPDQVFTMEYAKLLADCKNLDFIDLQASGINEETLAFLCKLPNLSKIDVSGTGITLEAVQKIHKANPERRIKIITDTGKVNTEVFGGESPAEWFKLE